MTGPRFHALFDGEPRSLESAIEQRHMDLAASIQDVTEDVVLRMARHLHEQAKMRHLVLAGEAHHVASAAEATAGRERTRASAG